MGTRGTSSRSFCSSRRRVARLDLAIEIQLTATVLATLLTVRGQVCRHPSTTEWEKRFLTMSSRPSINMCFQGGYYPDAGQSRFPRYGVEPTCRQGLKARLSELLPVMTSNDSQ
jgi:hypothetical protein